MAKVANVSVPFRGSCSEISVRSGEHAPIIAFPSPFGVRVLKFRARREYRRVNSKFPSPFGVRVLK